ncbi:protein SFI1 homolog [Tupaia chinensis]|uniref:protein SFI1 homolog n=1 Tax=Tupaia chinensis TaxID=246437 RepID=UPI0003C8DA71|nr:protein SFI1 homolog [Tupaia chinensis]
MIILSKKYMSSHWSNFHQKLIRQRMEKKVDSRSFRDGTVKKPYSSMVQPNKKSTAFSAICKELPPASHPVQHHVSHTWTRRGRLRELRVRCLARKFLYLWIRMTFGRVLPSKARLYYEQRILRKVFEEWEEEWWISRREWKLCVRADCHYRYYLYNLMFQNWKAYMQQQQEMRNKFIRAKDHDVKQKMRQAWKSWVIYVIVRRTKLQMQTTAAEFRQQSILRVWWSEWRQQLRQVLVSRALHDRAVKHRALSLKLQAWSRWQGQLLRSQKERQKVVSAVKYHQHWQKRRSLKAWLQYLQVRRMKRQQNEMAEQFHRVTVLQIHFCDWQWAWESRQSLYAHHALVEGLARRMALRRALAHWRHYVLLCAEDTAHWEMAEEHHRHQLLYFGLRALKGNVTHARIQRMRRNLSLQQHSITLLRRFWSLWQSQMEQREDREQLPLLRAAWNHYRITLLRKCFNLWLEYTRRRRHKQLLQARADGHFQQRALPAAFHAWDRLWRWRRQEQVLNTRAVQFHRETLEKRVFAVWRQKTFQHREHRLAERVAILHAEQRLLQRSWSRWHQQLAACCREREWQAVASAHHRHRRLRTAFCIWREHTRGLRTERTGRARAAEFHIAQLLHWAWSRWRECLAMRTAERRKLTRADLHRQHALLHRVLQKWVTYQGRVQNVLQEVAARESRHDRQLLRGVLRRWRENTMARVDEARKIALAHAHHRRTVCAKVLARWREAASVQIYYRQQEGCAIREARKVLDRGRLRTWFRRWWDCSQRLTQQRVQMQRAAWHHRRWLLQQGLARWKAHHLGCVRKRLLQRQGACLLAHRLSRACFRQWERQLVARQQERQATARALWFWSFSLQAKVWAAWRGFVLEKRRKKMRLVRALQAYQGQLLQEGATRLLRFASGVKASRQQLQAQQQAQAAHSLHRAVHRCAMLWKQKVLGPGRELQALAPNSPSRRVTFEGPCLNHGAAGTGDATLKTKRPRAPRPRGPLGSLALAAGEPQLQELLAARSARKQPRRPHFLLEPVQSQWSLGCGTPGRQGPEKQWEHCPGLAQQAGPFLTRPFPAEAQMPLVPSSLLPDASSQKLPALPRTSPGLLLLPPSSFMPRGAGAPARVSAQSTASRPKLQKPPSLASAPDPRLLFPGDFTSTRAGLGSKSAGVSLAPVGAVSAQGPPAQPSPGGKDGQDQAPAAAATGCSDLEAELEGIQRQLQHYQTTKQDLRSYQRQASSLRQWLELSREEPRPADQEAERQVQKELEEVEVQIRQLAEELRAQRQPISACVARVQALRQALS